VGLVESWGLLEHVLEHYGYVSSVAFSPDGSRVVSGSDDKSVRIWNATSREIECILGHLDVVRQLHSHLMVQVVSGSFDLSVRVWNENTGEIECILEEHSHGVWFVAFEPHGTGTWYLAPPTTQSQPGM
jgi:WD40 repeat protein